MKKILLIILAQVFLLSSVSALQVEDFLGLSYITGGVGIDEEQKIKEIGKDYTLQILVAQKNKFLSDVAITIMDADNQLVLETKMDGPYIFVNLEPGKYTINAEGFGESFTRKIKIKAGKQLKQVFVWP